MKRKSNPHKLHNHAKREKMILNDKKVSEQFYTTRNLVKELVGDIATHCGDATVFVDCSAGDGFAGYVLKQALPSLKHIEMYDLHPNALLGADLGTEFRVKKQDWFALQQLKHKPKKNGSIIIGFNPPFGFRGSEARKFVEHAVRLTSDIERVFIAMILPHIADHKNMGGETWVPPLFIEKFVKALPNVNSFYRLSDQSFPVVENVHFFIFEKNPTRYSLQLEEQKLRYEQHMAARPKGFQVGFITPLILRRKTCETFNTFPEGDHMVLIRTQHLAFIMKEEDGQVHHFNKHMVDTILTEDADFSRSQWKRIVFPPEFTSSQIKTAVSEFILPNCQKIMHERRGFWSASDYDIWETLILFSQTFPH